MSPDVVLKAVGAVQKNGSMGLNEKGDEGLEVSLQKGKDRWSETCCMS